MGRKKRMIDSDRGKRDNYFFTKILIIVLQWEMDRQGAVSIPCGEGGR